MLDRGLFERLITAELHAELLQLGDRLEVRRGELSAADAADRIALHVGRLIERAIEMSPEEERPAVGVALARKLILTLGEATPRFDPGPDLPVDPGKVLSAILNRMPDGSAELLDQPEIPLLDTTILTNAPGEPGVGKQVLKEIPSADRVDVVMAFIRFSGISPLLQNLRDHCVAGRLLRILTTTYTGTTEQRALDELAKLGADVRVSYDTTTTRLHAKAWLFHRRSGFSTAYIGSSNLTHSAQVTGLEWNVRVSAARNPSIVQKMNAVFESYWSGDDFIKYDPAQFQSEIGRTQGHSHPILLSAVELRPEPYQEQLLEQIALSRQQGHHRNLLVSATGTGKTVMAFVDYARLNKSLPRGRLLFVAHREEILQQARNTFRYGMRDQAFGELWVGGHRPVRYEHVFASIQSLNANGLSHLDRDHFDVVIIDEFHHAAASSYHALLEHLTPIELLGLTATPERSDGLPILEWFGNRIAAELRLWDAIDQHRLAPFAYFGIHDGMDLTEVPWKRGGGYDTEGLTRLLTSNDAWARRVIVDLQKRVSDVHKMKALGFCVSIEHAQFMARAFNEAGIAATAVWAETADNDRSSVLRDLAAGRIKAVFSVDLFNEGIDVPEVDTLLMLRPTDSPVLFIQQLGRGLRISSSKTVCTVLDFVGTHRKEFRYDRRFRALLGVSRKRLREQIEHNFPFLPAGCHMELDSVAAGIVLTNLKHSLPAKWAAKVAELRQLAQSNPEVTLNAFLVETGLELEDVYANNRSWADLVREAGLALTAEGPHDSTMLRACGRLLHVDDQLRIDAYRDFLSNTSPPGLHDMPLRERRLLRMLVASVSQDAGPRDSTLEEACTLLWASPQVRSELLQLLVALEGRITHVTRSLEDHPDVPLQIHAQYTRIEILTAFGAGEAERVRPPDWREGVRWVEDAGADLMAFTLDKSAGSFSPNTRYRDFAINRDLIHWQSQSGTSATSPTGTRYRQHEERGSSIMLFARLTTEDRGFYFLGPASYMSHESERPMSITWRLHHSLPTDLFTAFAAAVA